MKNISSKQLPIFCIGDSHSSFFAGINEVQRVWPVKSKNILPFFRVFPIGQTLAYNLTKLNTTTKGREKLFNILKQEVPKSSRVMLCFGEIDCRAHLLKQSEIQKRDIKDVVSECVNRYFSSVAEVKKMGYQVIIWNVIPSTRLNKIKNNIYPVIGSCKERNLITRLFNKLLQLKCKKSKVIFISTYNYFVDYHGLTNMSYYMDGIHLSQKAMPSVLKVIGKTLRLDFKLSTRQLLKYLLVNFYWDSLMYIKTIRRIFIHKFS